MPGDLTGFRGMGSFNGAVKGRNGGAEGREKIFLLTDFPGDAAGPREGQRGLAGRGSPQRHRGSQRVTEIGPGGFEDPGSPDPLCPAHRDWRVGSVFESPPASWFRFARVGFALYAGGAPFSAPALPCHRPPFRMLLITVI